MKIKPTVFLILMGSFLSVFLLLVILLNNSTKTNLTPVDTVGGSQLVYNQRVLAIGYNPSDGVRNIVDTYFSPQFEGRTASQQEDYAFNILSKDFNDLSSGRINFQVVKKINISSIPVYPDGSTFTIDSFASCVWGRPEFNEPPCNARKFTFDYVGWAAQNNICAIAEEYNVDEIWMLTPAYVVAWENLIIGPTAQGIGYVNGYGTPGCSKHYHVLSGAYDTPLNLLHNYGHRVEANMSFLTSWWSAADKHTYWESFAGVNRYNNPDTLYTTRVCGNAHFPANAAHAYDYANTGLFGFNCADWNNFPNFTGQQNDINCTAWGCVDYGWQKYWLGSLPHNVGEVSMNSSFNTTFQFKKDWWWYLLFADNTLTFTQQVLPNDLYSPIISNTTPSIPNNLGSYMPVFSFTSNEPGAATLEGGCLTANTNVTAGENSITMNPLNEGTYNCTLIVTDSNGNSTSPINIPPFTVFPNPQQPVTTQPEGDSSAHGGASNPSAPPASEPSPVSEPPATEQPVSPPSALVREENNFIHSASPNLEVETQTSNVTPPTPTLPPVSQPVYQEPVRASDNIVQTPSTVISEELPNNEKENLDIPESFPISEASKKNPTDTDFQFIAIVISISMLFGFVAGILFSMILRNKKSPNVVESNV